jgi:CBS domain-containing protein
MHAYVRDVMTTSVVTVRAGTPYRDMVDLLHAHRVSGLPVVDDDGRVVGVVSETDLLAPVVTDAGAHQGQGGRWPHRRRVTVTCTAADLMAHPAVTTSPDERVRNAARLMVLRGLRRLPVVDGDGRLVGIVSRGDLLSVFGRTDAEIRREIAQDVIADGFFTDPDRLTITVEDGIVTLAGAPGSVILGNSIVDQVRRVEGVVAVRDDFSYPQATADVRGSR